MRASYLLCLLVFSLVRASYGEWRFEIFGGKFFPGSSDLSINRPSRGDNFTYHGIKWADRSFDSPIYYGYRIAKFFGSQRKSGFELEFIHAKIYSDPESRLKVTGILDNQPLEGVRRLGEQIQLFDISHGLNLLLFNFTRREAWWKKEPFDPVGSYVVFRAGLGPCICHTESVIEGRFREQYEFGGLGFQISAGAVMPLKRRFYIPLEYKFTQAWLRDLEVDKGVAGMDLGGSHLILGVGFQY
ncbi:MAG TPA: hypothetical protein VM123_17060 [archaeon]|nr:hypothetical protein [archaeon]